MAFNIGSFSFNNGFKVTPSDIISAVSFADVLGIGTSAALFGDSSSSPAGRSSAGGAYVLYNQTHFQFMTSLANLGGSSGCVIIGESANDFTGTSIKGVGSLTPGAPESFLIGAPGYLGAGKVWLINPPGTNFCPIGIMDLASCAPPVCVKYTGKNAGDGFGTSVAGKGDYDGNGHLDLMMTAGNAGGNAGTTYSLYNNGSGFTQGGAIASLANFTVTGADTSTSLAFSADSAGYFTPDNRTDIIIVNSYYLYAYILTPPVGGFTGNLALFYFTSSWGYTASGGNCGTAFTSANKFNGVDSAVALSCPAETSNGDCIVIINYSDNLPSAISTGTPFSPGVELICSTTESSSYAASSLASGKFNNDTLTDLVVGEPQASPGAINKAGAAAMVFGTNSSVNNTVMGNLTAEEGLDIFGNFNYAAIGSIVGNLGDMTNDEIDEYVIISGNIGYVFCSSYCGPQIGGSTTTTPPPTSSSTTSSTPTTHCIGPSCSTTSTTPATTGTGTSTTPPSTGTGSTTPPPTGGTSSTTPPPTATSSTPSTGSNAASSDASSHFDDCGASSTVALVGLTAFCAITELC